MDSISVNGEKYVKAGSIAKELGYTADYVGQLARAKKIKATLIGRTWYVKVNSIREHKTSRYRTAAAKSKQEIKKQIIEVQENSKRSLASPASFSYVKQSYHPTVKYEADEEDLIPILTEVSSRALPGRNRDLRVELADAEKVKVRSSSQAYKVVTIPRPNLTFSGRLNISDLEQEQVAEEKPHRSGTIKIKKLEPKEVLPVKEESSLLAKKRRIPRSKGHHVSVVEQSPEEEPVVIHKAVRRSVRRRSRLGLLNKALVASLAVVILFGASTFEVKTVMVKGQLRHEYSVDKSPLIRSYNTLKNIAISSVREIKEKSPL